MRAVGIFSLGGRVDQLIGLSVGRTKDRAKVQIGAELLCKSAKVKLGVGTGSGIGVRKSFRCLEVGT